jgi:hypothetical protein
MTAILAAAALVLASCASGDNGTTDTSDDAAAVLSQCAEDAPECNDTATIGTDDDLGETGGDLPLAPDVSDSASGGMIIDGGLTIEEALAYDGTDAIAVSGFFVSLDGEARLCSVLAESFPPQCGGLSVTIANPEVLTSTPLVEEGSTQWSEDAVTLIGTITGDVFTIDALSA